MACLRRVERVDEGGGSNGEDYGLEIEATLEDAVRQRQHRNAGASRKEQVVVIRCVVKVLLNDHGRRQEELEAVKAEDTSDDLCVQVRIDDAATTQLKGLLECRRLDCLQNKER